MKRTIEDVFELEQTIREIILDKRKLLDTYKDIDYLMGEIAAYWNALHLIDLFSRSKEE